MATHINVMLGEKSPEGIIEASKGTFYVNTASSSVFARVSGADVSNKGWRILNIKGYYHGEGSPEGVVLAPKNSTYLDTENLDLYIQTVVGNPMVNTGWVSVNNGDILQGLGNPNILGTRGTAGDLFIDKDSTTLYLMSNSEWISIPLLVMDSTEVAIKLSELLTNTTSLNRQFFNMFFNTSPMDIELVQYDNEGTLQSYTIPNRAKDVLPIIGGGSPEGSVEGVQGKFYLDSNNGTVYVKSTGNESKEGWISLKRPNVEEPLSYNPITNTISIMIDSIPTEDSINLVNSSTLKSELDSIRNGNPNEYFEAADPVEPSQVTTKAYVDNIFSSMLQYDANTRTLYFNFPVNYEITEAGTVLDKDGTFYTPAYGTFANTEFRFNEKWAPETNTAIHIPTYCSIRVTYDGLTKFDESLGKEITIEPFSILYNYLEPNTNVKIYTDKDNNGIASICVTELFEYNNPAINIAKDVMKSFTLTTVEDEPEEE